MILAILHNDNLNRLVFGGQVLVSNVQEGRLTLEGYLDQLREAVKKDVKLATALRSRKDDRWRYPSFLFFSHVNYALYSRFTELLSVVPMLSLFSGL